LDKKASFWHMLAFIMNSMNWPDQPTYRFVFEVLADEKSNSYSYRKNQTKSGLLIFKDR